MVATPNKGYLLPVTGTLAGTWGDALNDQVTSYVDVNLGGITTLSLASTTPVTLTATEARNGLLVFTGALLANIAVTTSAVGVFWVENRTTGNFYVSLTNGTGNAMLVPQGTARQVWSDATYGVRALGLDPPGTFKDLGAATPHPSLLATASLVGEYLLCDGSAFSTTGVTANLYQAIGTTWGAGPLLPDLRGRTRFGKDDMGGSAANRITNSGSGIVGTTVGSVGGAQNVTLSISEMPSHNHGGATGAHAHGLTSYVVGTGIAPVGGGSAQSVANNPVFSPNTDSNTASIASQGGGGAHNNMPPTGICNVLIKI